MTTLLEKKDPDPTLEKKTYPGPDPTQFLPERIHLLPFSFGIKVEIIDISILCSDLNQDPTKF